MKQVTESKMHDRFGLVLALIGAILVLLALPIDTPVWRALLLSLQGATLAIALLASDFNGKLVRVTVLVTAIGVITSLSVWLLDISVPNYASLILMALLAAVAPLAIGSRLFRHTKITGQTVFGALCVFLLVGLFFALVFNILDTSISGGVLRSSNDDPLTYLSTLYFSFVTLTTLGYGDVVPSSDVTRILSVLEALIGQLYLVTVVALIVGNIGQER